MPRRSNAIKEHESLPTVVVVITVVIHACVYFRFSFFAVAHLQAGILVQFVDSIADTNHVPELEVFDFSKQRHCVSLNVGASCAPFIFVYLYGFILLNKSSKSVLCFCSSVSSSTAGFTPGFPKSVATPVLHALLTASVSGPTLSNCAL